MMTRTLTAGVLALSMAMTSMAPAPVAAQISNEDAIAGIFALILLGAAIHHSRDDDDDDDDRDHRPEPPRGADETWRVLPVACLRHATRTDGTRTRYYGQWCIDQRYPFTHRLPDRCHVQFRTSQYERRQGYDARCMRDAGFRMSRH